MLLRVQRRFVVRLLITFALFSVATCIVEAEGTPEYPVSIEIFAIEQVVIGSRTEVTPRTCESKRNSLTGKDYTECTGGDSRLIEDKETRFTARLTEGEARIVEIICSNRNVWQGCLDLQAETLYRARWKEPKLLAIAYQNRKGQTKEVMYDVRPAPSVPQQATAGESLCKLSSIPDHAEIAVDGEFVGQTPADLRLAAGRHTIELSAEGYRPFVRTLTGIAGSTVTLNITLDKR
jgi:hypothetical protein